MGAPAVQVKDMLAQAPELANVPGVYLLSHCVDASTHVYIGRTKTKSVLGRLKDHCRMRTGSDLAGMLPRHATFPQETSGYYLRWVAVPDATERAQLELFAIAVLRPPFNRYI